MIYYKSGDVYLNEDANIIFNPVGVIDNHKGFLQKIKTLYPDVYTEYSEFIWMCGEKELLGDIQLVKIGDKRLMLNGFCINRRGNIDKLALTKSLVELCNLAYEYKLSVSIEYGLGIVHPKEERKAISMIIKEVFKDVDGVDVFIYDRNRK